MIEKNYIRNIVVLLFLFLLASQILLARFSSGSILSSDSYTMQNVLYWECSLRFETFLPPVRCLGSILKLIFNNPLLYLMCIIALKGFTFFLLYRIFIALDDSCDSQPTTLAIPLFAVLFLVVGIRQFHLGQDILLHSDLHTRSWAQVLIVFSLLRFLERRNLSTSIFLGAAVFFHPTNSLNVFIVLFVSTFILNWGKGYIRPALVLVIPFCVALAVQYIAAFGHPQHPSDHNINCSIEENFAQCSAIARGAASDGETSAILEKQPTQTDAGLATIDGKERNFSVRAWYEFVYSQDPDDLSLKYLFNSRLGFAYLVLQLMGFYLTITCRDKSARKNVLKDPVIAICLSAYSYLFLSLLVEYFQAPGLVLEKLIILQPRRVLYLPLILLSYSITKAVYEFFAKGTIFLTRRFVEIFVFFAIIFLLLEFTSDGDLEQRWAKLVFYSVFLAALSLYFFLRKREIINGKIVQSTCSALPIVALLVVTMKASAATSFGTLYDVKRFFGELGPRSYSQYLLLEASINEEERAIRDLLEASNWAQTAISENKKVLTIGFYENWEINFIVLTNPNFVVQTMNVYRIRGAMHYNFATFRRQIGYYEELLGIPAEMMGREDGTTVIAKLDQVVADLGADGLTALKTTDGKLFDYIFSAYELPVDWIIPYQNDSFIAYKRPTE